MKLFDAEVIDFKYGGVPLSLLPCRQKTEADGCRFVRTRAFENGLEAVTEGRYMEAFGAYEWKTTFRNGSSDPSGVISELWDCAVDLPLPHDGDRRRTAYMPRPEECAYLYSPCGSTWTEKEFYDDPRAITGETEKGMLFPGWKKRVSASGGRSSEANAPFFHIRKGNTGYVIAVGWSGQWTFMCERTNDSVKISSGIEGVRFYLKPGESVSTSSAVIMPYTGSFIDGQNKWRRLVKEHFSLIGQPGRLPHGPLCAGIWGGMSTRGVMERLDIIDKSELPFEYIWMDAGWYGEGDKPSPDEFEGDWPEHTGDWRVNLHYHPDGLKEVSRRIHAGGHGFLLWFEPERVRKNTPVAREHPEYFLRLENRSDWLLNLGNESAFQYCLDMLCEKIETLGIDFFRQDFNISPLAYWNAADEADRSGITQIKYINGLYRLWDELLRRFPRLMIDNCSSGGRRIDIETLKRSVPLWRSDAMCPADFRAETAQCHALTFPMWLPYSGTGAGRRCDTYLARSCYSPALTTNYTFSERDAFGDDESKLKWIKRMLLEYRKVRPYLDGDFYPLTSLSTQNDVWTVVQYDRPETKDGVVLAFRRAECGFSRGEFVLGGSSEQDSYTFTDSDSGEVAHVTGNLLTIEILEKRSSRLLFYTKD
ncbi:MAG: alpha-galactosidase [Clostridia bacterium]|nr:alpha-galactosidase [Clostridia bacterium]